MSVVDWGTLIVRLRTEAGLSQRQLADRARVNRRTLSLLERGLARGDIEFVERALGYLGYELDAMLAEERDVCRRRIVEDETDPSRRAALAARWLLGIGSD